MKKKSKNAKRGRALKEGLGKIKKRVLGFLSKVNPGP